jgi:hypothetical protein
MDSTIRYHDCSEIVSRSKKANGSIYDELRPRAGGNNFASCVLRTAWVPSILPPVGPFCVIEFLEVVRRCSLNLGSPSGWLVLRPWVPLLISRERRKNHSSFKSHCRRPFARLEFPPYLDLKLTVGALQTAIGSWPVSLQRGSGDLNLLIIANAPCQLD